MSHLNKRHTDKTNGLFLDNIVNDQSTHGARIADKARAAKFQSPDISKQIPFKLGTAIFYFANQERLERFKKRRAEEIKAYRSKIVSIFNAEKDNFNAEIQQP